MGAVPSRPTAKIRANGRPPKPRDRRCEACGGRAPLRWHHCHDCGQFVAWLCDACNTTLTEHAIEHWDAIFKAHCHECTARLFDVPRATDAGPRDRYGTRTVHLSNGAGDPRTYSASTLDGYITVEQFAVAMGVNAQTARDIASGRQNRRPLGEQINGTWFVPHHAVLMYLEQRWGLKT